MDAQRGEKHLKLQAHLQLPVCAHPIVPAADREVSTTTALPATRRAPEKPHQVYLMCFELQIHLHMPLGAARGTRGPMRFPAMGDMPGGGAPAGWMLVGTFGIIRPGMGCPGIMEPGPGIWPARDTTGRHGSDWKRETLGRTAVLRAASKVLCTRANSGHAPSTKHLLTPPRQHVPIRKNHKIQKTHNTEIPTV